MVTPYHIILASNSPRRKELLSGLDLDYEVKVLPDIEETYPDSLPTEEIPLYIAEEKAADDARRMLRELSGRTHQVITGVCLMTKDKKRSFAVTTDVTFKALTNEEINYYVETYKPLDKAGAYGIQEWIGYIGVTGLNGSYFNVMGLPVQRIYNELKVF